MTRSPSHMPLGSADEIDLIGITATYGNVAVPLAARNALAVLHLFGRDDVPVYPGVDHPIAPATLPKMRGTTPDERAQAYARWQNGGADGWQTDASWSPTPGSVAVHHPNGIGGAIIPRLPARSGSTRLGGRFHHHRRARIRPGPDHRAYGRDDHHGHRIPQRSGP